MGLVAPRHVESSQTTEQTHVPYVQLLSTHQGSHVPLDITGGCERFLTEWTVCGWVSIHSPVSGRVGTVQNWRAEAQAEGQLLRNLSQLLPCGNEGPHLARSARFFPRSEESRFFA